MKFLYLPFLYTFHTRLLSSTSKIAWVTTYLLPVFIVFFLLDLDFLFYLVLIFCIYLVYEVGYIVNDFEVTKNEKNPTMRVSDGEINYYENNKIKVFLFRLIILIIVCFFVYLKYLFYFNSLLLTLLAILLIYCIYNSIRNNFNLPLYSLLVHSRYFLFFCFICKDVNLFILLFLSYPMCALIEFSSKKRFWTSRFIKILNFDKFRVYYYLFMFLIGVFLYFYEFNYSELFLILITYFLFYRIFSFLFLSKKFRSN